jgi:hypothetical protein
LLKYIHDKRQATKRSASQDEAEIHSLIERWAKAVREEAARLFAKRTTLTC